MHMMQFHIEIWIWKEKKYILYIFCNSPETNFNDVCEKLMQTNMKYIQCLKKKKGKNEWKDNRVKHFKRTWVFLGLCFYTFQNLFKIHFSHLCYFCFSSFSKQNRNMQNEKWIFHSAYSCSSCFLIFYKCIYTSVTCMNISVYALTGGNYI